MKNKKSNKKVFKIRPITILIILVIISIVFFVVKMKNKKVSTATEPQNASVSESYVEEIQDGIKINKSTKLNEAKTVDGLTITNIQLTTKSGMTNLLADVINNGQEQIPIKSVQITLLDTNQKELTTVTGIVNSLKPGESTELNISMTSDFINAYDFEVKTMPVK